MYAECDKKDCTNREYKMSQQCNEGIIGGVKKALRTWTTVDQNLDEKIVRNYYIASTVNTNGSPSYYDPCYFLFFWIGDKIKDKLRATKPYFADAMKDIYASLANFPWNGRDQYQKRVCTNIYPEIMKTVFKVLKEFFDYEYNSKALKDKEECNKYFSSQYITDRASAQDGYSWSCSKCGNSENKYCTEFKQKYMKNGVCTNSTLPQLTCKTVQEPEPVEVQRVKQRLLQEDGESDELPSMERYYGFDRGEGNHGDRSEGDEGATCNWKEKETALKAAVGTALGSYAQINVDKEKIAKAWCHVTNGANEEAGAAGEVPKKNVEGVVYDLLYYWLGSKVCISPGRSKTFSKIMGEIFSALQSVFSDITYGRIYKDIDEDTFKNMEILFRYNLDKDTITADPEGEGKPCPPKYEDYLQKVQCAYKTVRAQCEGEENSGSGWCQKFQEWYPKDKQNDELDIKCKLASTEDCTEISSPEYQGSLAQSTTATAISSILGLVGIPSIVFFLYKYGLLPSWFGNDSRRTSTKRRTTKNEFNTLGDDSTVGGSTTEYDSTLDSGTDYSTSNLSRTTIDNSTIYEGPSRRGRTNNGRKSQQQQNRKNISYRRM